MTVKEMPLQAPPAGPIRFADQQMFNNNLDIDGRTHVNPLSYCDTSSNNEGRADFHAREEISSLSSAHFLSRMLDKCG